MSMPPQDPDLSSATPDASKPDPLAEAKTVKRREGERILDEDLPILSRAIL